MAEPLAGVVVVSLEQAVAAPFATRQLADLGATVIKIERPGGDFARAYDRDVNGMSTHFAWTNRGKHSVVLDLKDAGDRGTFDELVAGADVFVHNIAPSAAQRLGLDPSSMRSKDAGLIACVISGYGAGGPISDSKAYDLAVQAEAGAFSLSGHSEPGRVGFAAADVAAGMYAFSGILAALYAREQTGEGATIEVAMLDSLVEWLSAQLYSAHYSGAPVPRTGRRHPGIAPYGTFATADGRSVLVAVQNDREWAMFATQVLDDADLADDPRFRTNPDRIAHVVEVEALVAARLSGLDRGRAVSLLQAAGIAVADVNELADVWDHPQLRARDRFLTVDSPVGPVELLAPPLGRRDGAVMGIPAIGQHDPRVIADVVARGRARRDDPPSA